MPTVRSSRFRLVAVVAPLLLLMVAVPALTRPAAAAGEIVVGELQRTWLQHATPSVASGGPLTWIHTDGGSVRIVTHEAAHLPVGSTVEVTLGDDAIDLAAMGGFVPAKRVLRATVVQPAPAATTPATNEVLVVGAVRQGRTPDPTTETVQRVVDSVNGSVHSYWDEQSNGAIKLAATAWPAWITTTADCTDIQGVWDEVAAAVGFTRGPGKHLLVYGAGLGESLPGCSYGEAEEGAGRGTGGRSYVRGWDTVGIVHALGHNFGLGDSSAETCTALTESRHCRTEPGGDWYDPMGANTRDPLGSLSPPQAARLGVLPADQRQSLATMADVTRDFTVLPAGGRTGLRTIELPDRYTGHVYWLEYRTATGRDAWLGTPSSQPVLQTGVLVRRTSPGDRSTLLLDPTPTSTVWSGGITWEESRQVALPVGTELRLGDYRITLVSQSAGGAVLRVSAPTDGPAGDVFCDARWRPSTPLSGVALLSHGGTTSAVVVGTDRAVWMRPIEGSATSWWSLGGGLTYGPAAVTAGTTAYVFGTGSDGGLWFRSESGAGWSGWQTLGGKLTGSPAAASLGEGHVRVVGRAPDGSMWSRELRNGSWSPWTSHGGYLSSPPTATADLAAGRVRVSVRGGDGRLYEQALAAGAQPAAFEPQNVTTCSALAMGPTRSANDHVRGAYLNGRSEPRLLFDHGSRSLGGALTSIPAVQMSGDGVLVAGRGGDGSLWLYDGRAGRNRWVPLGGRIA